MIQLYALAWMLVNGVSLYMMRDTASEEEGSKKADELIEEIEFMEKFSSYRFDGRELLIYFFAFLAMDVLGYYLAAGHVEFAPWARSLFYAAVAVLAVDAVLELYSLYDIIHTKDHDKSVEKLAEGLHSEADSGSLISFLALSGKFITSVALVLWTVFPR